VPYVYNPTFVGKEFSKNCIVPLILPAYTTYEEGKTECSETPTHKIQKPGNHPKEEYNMNNKAKILNQDIVFCYKDLQSNSARSI